ncbi:MAG TPA: DUF4157 domain-containing protein [Herpetosiphonaceae bacterium]
MAAPPIVDEVIASHGQPLDAATRGFMEARFGHDFGGVRVHADAKANESARQIAALAYTSGPNIVFASNRYDPVTAAGRRLLAHELAHVVQQTSGGPASGVSRAIQRQPDPAAGTGPLQLPPVGSVDLRENASPLLASALGSTTVDRFGMGSAAIPKAGEDSLRYAARQILFFIRKYPRSTVHIAGHTDRVGTDERNLDLGQQRADAVMAFLQQEGVPPEIMSTESKGESEPVVPTKNDQPEPRNRRVNVFFRVEKSTLSLGLDPSLKPPSPPQAPPTTVPVPTIPKLPLDFGLGKPRIPYRDPAETEMWKRYEEDRRKIEEFDRTHPRETKSLGQAVIDLVMKDVVKPILKELPLPEGLRKKAEEGIRKGLEAGSEKACEAAIDQLNVGSSEKDALKAACKAALKQKPGGKP